MDSDKCAEKSEKQGQNACSSKVRKGLVIEGYPVEGLSIGGQETCIIFPTLKMAFDIGRCPQRAISQDFLFISHGHMDHIGGLPIEMDQSELKHNLVGLNVGEEYIIRKDLKVKAFRTYHVIPSQGYIIYSVKQKLKQEYTGLSGNEIKNLRLSGVEITYTVTSPEIAFTGDTMSDFIVDPSNIDALKARILVMESTFVNKAMTIENARDYGHIHLFEIERLADLFQNKAILLIHFSARYRTEEIEAAILNLPRSLATRTFALTEGF